MALTLTSFIKQLVVKLSEDPEVRLPLRNQNVWHKLLYSLKQSNEAGKPAFLNDLWFDWDGPSPEAPELSEFLARLHWGASISAANPQYETASLPRAVADVWKTQALELNPQEQAFLESAVNRAKQAFGTAVHA